MRNIRSVTIVFAALVLTLPALAVTITDGVPLYTNEDLNRMFGPAPKGPSVPVDKSKPEDWIAIQQFIDNQYARIDAERQYELETRAMAQVQGGSCEPAASDGYSGSYFPAWWLYPVGGSNGRGFHPGGRFYRPQNPQLPFGNTQLPRALPPGGLHPTLSSHVTAHPNRPIVNSRPPMVAPRSR